MLSCWVSRSHVFSQHLSNPQHTASQLPRCYHFLVVFSEFLLVTSINENGAPDCGVKKYGLVEWTWKRSEKVSTLFQKISIFSAANNTFWSMNWCTFSELNGWNFTHQSPDRHPKFACQILDIFPETSGKPTETIKEKLFSEQSFSQLNMKCMFDRYCW